jgi:hypothetical protein
MPTYGGYGPLLSIGYEKLGIYFTYQRTAREEWKRGRVIDHIGHILGLSGSSWDLR